MPELVAIDLAGGPAFVDALRSVWDNGNAAFVVDRRHPPAVQQAVLAAMAPVAVIDGGGRHRLGSGRPVEQGDAVVVATSGATGQPKGVVLTHEAVRASAHAVHRRLGASGADHWLACLPLAHIGGLAVVLRALVDDVDLTVHDGFDAAAVEASPATLVSLVPTALARIDPGGFRWIVLGGSAAPPVLPANVVATYGMTETGSGIVYGGLPLDGVELRIGADHVINVRAPTLLRCYRDGSDPKDADGWLATGDLGELDPDGRLRVHGRAGDLIITGGENVWPEPVERVLAGIAGVADVAVVGVDDPEWGQAVTAVVVPAAGTSAPTLAALREAVKEQLPAYCAPHRLVLVVEIARTSLGKVRRDLARAAALR